MAIYKVEKNRNYTVMGSYHLFDLNLSLKAIGLLSKMFTLSDKWDYTTRGLTKICKEGVDSISSALKELEANGYLVRKKIRDSKGKIVDTQYLIFERPYNYNPDMENPYMDKVCTEKHAQLNNINNKTNNELKIDRESERSFTQIIWDEINEAKTIPKSYLQDKEKMSKAIHLLTDYEQRLEYFLESADTADCNFAKSVFIVFNEALIEMLTTSTTMILKGVEVKNTQVYEKLERNISFEDKKANIEELFDITFNNFSKACKNVEIINHMQYMKACIWNVLQVGDIAIQASIKHDFA